jgi:hypothetical protein
VSYREARCADFQPIEKLATAVAPYLILDQRSFIVFPPVARRYLTHYLVMQLPGGQILRVGEAGSVQTLKRQEKWRAHVGEWAVDPVANRLRRGKFRYVQWRIVQGPQFLLVRKRVRSKNV